MDIDEYQRRAGTTDQVPLTGRMDALASDEPCKAEVIPLLGLVGEVGSLLGEYKKLLRDGATHRKFRDEVAEELGDVLWYVANVASKFNLSLGEIARQNLRKVEDRWTASAPSRVLYDEELPDGQRLPRTFAYAFQYVEINGAYRLVLIDRLRGDSTGDPLSDNTYSDDGYRFHDVLHLTMAACLGWSPVLRKLLRRRDLIVNREPAMLADAEDGGRAQVIEEAIVAAAYVYAADNNLLEGARAVDWQLLRHIKRMTAGIEVQSRTTREWNDAILRGFAIWRLLRAHDGGVVRGDLHAGTIDFDPPAR